MAAAAAAQPPGAGPGRPQAGEPAAEVVARAVAESGSGERRVRIQAIRALARHPEPQSVEALTRLLSEEPVDPAVREENWYEAARALRAIASREPLPAEVVARLAALASRKPSVMRLNTTDYRVPIEGPRFPFDVTAAEAIRASRRTEAKHALTRDVEGIASAERIERLSALAWGAPASIDPDRRASARELLREEGAAGLSAAEAAVSAAPEESQLALVNYFAEVCEETSDARCVKGLAALAATDREPVWQAALMRIGDLKAPGAADSVVAQLRERGVRGDSRTELALETLGRLDDATAAPFLSEQLGSDQPKVGGAAARALARLGESGVRALAESSRSPDPRRRRAALEGLERRRDDPVARRALEDARRAHPEDVPDAGAERKIP